MIKLFLDVDDVLTLEAVNVSIARQLGVEKELYNAEQEFRLHKMPSAEFGQILVDVFRKRGLDRSWLNMNLPNCIKPRPGAEELLKLIPGFTYLVSSGPNYYVNYLQNKFCIPDSNVLCSEYLFDNIGNHLISCCRTAIDVTDKSKFVDKNRHGNVRLTVGIGNSENQDGAFLTLCDFQFILRKLEEDYGNEGFIYVYELASYIRFVKSLGLWTFSVDDIKLAGLERLVRALKEPSNSQPILLNVREKLGQNTRSMVDKFFEGTNEKHYPIKVQTLLAGDLNRIITQSPIFDLSKLPVNNLSIKTKVLLQQNPCENLVRLNRLVLNDVYPEYFQRNNELEDSIKVS